MASYKLNIARLSGTLDATALLAQVLGIGLNENYGILNAAGTGTDKSVAGTVAIRKESKVGKLDQEHKLVTQKLLDNYKAIPFIVWPAENLIATLAGSKASIQDVVMVLDSTGTVYLTETIEREPLELVRGLMDRPNFKLCSARISNYAADSYTWGSYSAKFLSTESGIEFLEKNEAAIVAVGVKFNSDHARKVAVTLTPNCCFSFACKEDDELVVRGLLHGLVTGDRKIAQAVRDLCPTGEGCTSVTFSSGGKSVTLTGETRKKLNAALKP